MEFTLTGNPEQVVAAERKKVEDELAALLSNIKAETENAKKLAASKAKTLKKIELRKGIQAKHDSAVEKAEENLRMARIRARNSQSKLAILEADVSESMIATKRIKKLKIEVREKQDNAKRHLDSLGELLKGVVSVQSLLDVNQPVLHRPNEMSWTTAPVQIYDKDGSLLPTQFGRFKVTLSKSSSGRFNATMIPLEPSTRRDDLAHPHVRTNGQPCLGDASNQLLGALRENNLQSAILLVHNYLTHYNIRDPYTAITWWEPDALWHMPECECGITTAVNCGCDKCKACGSVFQEDGGQAVKSNGGCKSCTMCCSTIHMSASGDMIPIPDSTCVHRSIY